MPSDINDLQSVLPDLSDGDFNTFKQYFEILRDFNSKMNLVSNSTISIAGKKHFADSYLGLELLKEIFSENQKVYDLGSGNGFPGVVLGIVRPEIPVVLVERDLRKAEFLKHITYSLELKNIEIFAGDVADLPEGSASICISRAMSPMSRMLLQTRKLVPQGGNIYLFKNEHWTSEFSAIPAQLFDFWEVEVKKSYSIGKSDIKNYIIHCRRV